MLNLSVAPWSIITPFKLDEVIRVNELRTINGSLTRAIMTVIIDRSMDGPMFVIFSLILSAYGMDKVSMFAGLFGLAMVAVTVGFFAASQILEFAQRYIFLYHYQPRALYALRTIHTLRELAALGRQTIKTAAPILFVCTLGIWVFELASVGIMLWIFSPDKVDLTTTVSAALVRANLGWRALLFGGSPGFPAALITKLFFAALLIVWPVAVWIYYNRRFTEVRDAKFLNRQWGFRDLEKSP
jgi:hypothetical protein